MEGPNMTNFSRPSGPMASNVPPKMAPDSDGPDVDDRERQIYREIKKRRYQRWAFYAIISVLFIFMIFYIVKISNDNLKLVEDISNAKQTIENTSQSLTEAEQQLVDRQRQIVELEREIASSQDALNQKAEELRQATEGQSEIIDKYNEFKVKLGSSDANVFSFLINFSTGVSAQDIAKIPLAQYNFGGDDTDGDGLSDRIEAAFGTAIDNRDTDSDGYSDKEELLNGYNPLGADKLPIDATFTEMSKGLILIQVEQNGEAWYVSPKDGKRYFLGRPAEVLGALEAL